MIGNNPNPIIAGAIGNIFGKASEAVREARGRDADAQMEGEPGRREDSDTDYLIDQMRGVIRGALESLGQRFKIPGQLDIDFHPTKMQDEATVGADVGIRVSIETPDYSIVKGALFQCKRMFAGTSGSDFRELRGRGEEQAKMMLGLTPASFFLLFSHGEQASLLNMAGIPASMVCPNFDEHVPFSKQQGIADRCPIWARTGGGCWDMGISVLPAARVLARSRAAKGNGSLLPIRSVDVLPGAWPLGIFLADLLGACFVGDVRREIVQAVTPPLRRPDVPDPFGPTGLTNVGVRHIIDMRFRSDYRS